jgi:2-polyprenyl-3-methyl-5-hydroxy-6-metoxy-1,4-benzoquinol methylase
MTFPHHDRNWTEVASFVRERMRSGDTILAPDTFWWVLDDIYRYVETFRKPSRQYDFAIVHKGEIARLNTAALDHIVREGRCVFANAVFVVWSSRPDLHLVSTNSIDLNAFFERRRRLTADDLEQGRSEVMNDDTVLPDPGRITKFETLEPRAFINAMDSFWQNGGYRYTTRRDQVYYDEISQVITEFCSHWKGRRILDLACGRGRLPQVMHATNHVVGVDISAVATGHARRSSANTPYAVMDAHRIGLVDHSFDSILFIDAIEHVASAAIVLSEIARVLAPSGELVVTVANRNSLHEIIGRKLGFPEFKTNYQHIQEFTFQEIQGLLEEKGFSIEKSKGIFLYPFWGVPLLDGSVRQLTDEDPEVVEILRLLGERVGPEYAYAFAVRAVKHTR